MVVPSPYLVLFFDQLRNRILVLGVTFHLYIPQWTVGLSWKALELLCIHGLLECQGPVSVRELTWGKDESWQWDRLPSGSKEGEFREASWPLQQVPLGKISPWGYVGEWAGSSPECWAPLVRDLTPHGRLRHGPVGQCIILHFGCSFTLQGWMYSLCRVLPYGTVAGTSDE